MSERQASLIDAINQDVSSVRVESLIVDAPYVTVRLDDLANATEAAAVAPHIRVEYPEFTIRFYARGVKIHEVRPEKFEDDLEVLRRANSNRMLMP